MISYKFKYFNLDLHFERFIIKYIIYQLLINRDIICHLSWQLHFLNVKANNIYICHSQ